MISVRGVRTKRKGKGENGTGRTSGNIRHDQSRAYNLIDYRPIASAQEATSQLLVGQKEEKEGSRRTHRERKMTLRGESFEGQM